MKPLTVMALPVPAFLLANWPVPVPSTATLSLPRPKTMGEPASVMPVVPSYVLLTPEFRPNSSSTAGVMVAVRPVGCSSR